MEDLNELIMLEQVVGNLEQRTTWRRVQGHWLVPTSNTRLTSTLLNYYMSTKEFMVLTSAEVPTSISTEVPTSRKNVQTEDVKVPVSKMFQ